MTNTHRGWAGQARSSVRIDSHLHTCDFMHACMRSVSFPPACPPLLFSLYINLQAHTNTPSASTQLNYKHHHHHNQNHNYSAPNPIPTQPYYLNPTNHPLFHLNPPNSFQFISIQAMPSFATNTIKASYNGHTTTVLYWADGNGRRVNGCLTSLAQLKTTLRTRFGVHALTLYCVVARRMRPITCDKHLVSALADIQSGGTLLVNVYKHESPHHKPSANVHANSTSGTATSTATASPIKQNVRLSNRPRTSATRSPLRRSPLRQVTSKHHRATR